MQPVIQASGLGKVYPARSDGKTTYALEDINFAQNEGEFVAVMGPSGCGKSTLLNIIAGFEKATKGSCLVNGKPVANIGPDRGVVFQEYGLFPWMTVTQNVAFAIKAAGKWNSKSPARIEGILNRMGVVAFREAFPKDLSGGMRQRVAIGRILAIDSPVMLMDEPFGALDALTRSAMQAELMELWAETKKTILFITHGVEEAIYLADRVLVMTPRPGRIVLDLPIELERPRDVTDRRFNEYRRQILDIIHPSLAAA